MTGAMIERRVDEEGNDDEEVEKEAEEDDDDERDEENSSSKLGCLLYPHTYKHTHDHLIKSHSSHCLPHQTQFHNTTCFKLNNLKFQHNQ